jgi:SAM-dependent methyltransferase
MTTSTDPLVAIVSSCLAGEISPPVTIARLLVLSDDVAAMHRAVEQTASHVPAESERLSALRALLPTASAGCARIARIVREELGHAVPTSAEHAVARTRRLFDRCVAECEEASVALYSLGDPALLEATTDELVRALGEWGLIAPGRAVLDVGCGIGRIAARLAPLVGFVRGIDISTGMIAASRRRCAALPNVRFDVGDGIDLGTLGAARFDVVLAIDTFPYVVDAGEARVARTFGELHRVLREGGELVLVNYSYRGRPDTDRSDVQRLARATGFEVRVSGARPFELWDGTVFRLVRRAALAH